MEKVRKLIEGQIHAVDRKIQDLTAQEEKIRKECDGLKAQKQELQATLRELEYHRG